MKRIACTVVAALALGHTVASLAYPWDQDMVDQPSANPQESPAPAEPNAVPVIGGETVPAPMTVEGMLAAKAAAAAIANPVPVTPAALAKGAYLYEINCLVCHGAEGRGDGPVAAKIVTKAPVDLNEDYTQDQADGQLFFTLTRGREVMPYYRDALSVEERWDVVNYVKDQFGEK